MKPEWGEKAAQWCRKRLGKYRYVLLVLLVGAVFLLWPGAERESREESRETAEEMVFSVEQLERRLETVLGRIEGAGEVSVLLTVRQGVEQILAQDSDCDAQREQVETVVISTGSGKQETVTLSSRGPTFQGALVVCPGGADPQVKLLLTQAVCGLTGLGAARVTVCKGG